MCVVPSWTSPSYLIFTLGFHGDCCRSWLRHNCSFTWARLIPARCLLLTSVAMYLLLRVTFLATLGPTRCRHAGSHLREQDAGRERRQEEAWDENHAVVSQVVSRDSVLNNRMLVDINSQSLQDNKRRLVLHDMVAPAASHLGNSVRRQRRPFQGKGHPYR